MAAGDARKAADAWLKKQGIIADVTDEDYEQVKKLIGMPGFGIFWAMLMFHRQNQQAFLGNAPLGTPQADCAASVLQGSIKCIDHIREIILNIAEPPADAAGEDKEQM